MPLPRQSAGPFHTGFRKLFLLFSSIMLLGGGITWLIVWQVNLKYGPPPPTPPAAPAPIAITPKKLPPGIFRDQLFVLENSDSWYELERAFYYLRDDNPPADFDLDRLRQAIRKHMSIDDEPNRTLVVSAFCKYAEMKHWPELEKIVLDSSSAKDYWGPVFTRMAELSPERTLNFAKTHNEYDIVSYMMHYVDSMPNIRDKEAFGTRIRDMLLPTLRVMCIKHNMSLGEPRTFDEAVAGIGQKDMRFMSYIFLEKLTLSEEQMAEVRDAVRPVIQNTDPKIRWRAMDVFFKYSTPAQFDEAAKLIDHQDPDIAGTAAAYALILDPVRGRKLNDARDGKMGSMFHSLWAKRAVSEPALIELLLSTNRSTVMEAARLLGEIGTLKALPKIAEARMQTEFAQDKMAQSIFSDIVRDIEKRGQK